MSEDNEAHFPYENLIVDIPDYPEPGVIFKDVTPLISNAQGLAACADAISDHFLGKGITKVIGSEASALDSSRLASPANFLARFIRRATPLNTELTSCRFTPTP